MTSSTWSLRVVSGRRPLLLLSALALLASLVAATTARAATQPEHQLVAAPSTPLVEQQSASALGSATPVWSSGAYTAHDAAAAAGFAAWRGRPLGNLAVFPSRDSWDQLLQPWYLGADVIPAGFAGDLVVGVPLWPNDSSVDVDASQQWKTFARQLAAVDPDAFVRLGWEMNIGQPWRITAENEDQWAAAFTRAVAAMRAVAPDLRIVWNPNWGPDQTDTDTRLVFQQVKSSVDVYGIDSYDAWPPDVSAEAWQQRLNGPRGLAESLTYAQANGKPFSVPEWGVACSAADCQWAGHAGGDNPRYVNDMLTWMAAAGPSLAFESYFNEPDPYVRSELSPGSTNPQAAEAYRSTMNQLSQLAAGPPAAASSGSPSAEVVPPSWPTPTPSATPSEAAALAP